ncbi:MAG: hypothetical protein HYV63_32855 [Candidatus Schekmanbacteria bacterium]|nr:hypothetical protein [Candidatus Schekmanbacteria bacterium]
MQRIGSIGYLMIASDSGSKKGNGGMKIEHVVARETEPRRMYEWDNLLGVCGGVIFGPKGQVDHCDTSKGAQKITVHPGRQTPDPEAVFVYRNTGRVEGSIPEARVDIDILNLNAQRLVDNRKDLIHDLHNKLRSDDGIRAIQSLYKAATTPNSEGLLPPFALIRAQYLAKKLHARRVRP